MEERLKERKFSDTVAKNRGLYPLICKLMNFSDPEKSLVTPDSLLKNYNTCLSSLENMVAEKKHTEIQSTVDSTNEAVKLFPSTRPEFLLTIVSEEDSYEQYVMQCHSAISDESTEYEASKTFEDSFLRMTIDNEGTSDEDSNEESDNEIDQEVETDSEDLLLNVICQTRQEERVGTEEKAGEKHFL